MSLARDKKYSILIVEDEADHVDLIVSAFAKDPKVYDLHVVETLEKAREFIAQGAPDLVISDLYLPDGEGMELLADADHNPLPLILMTAHSNEAVAVKAIKNGALEYVVKTPENFLEMPHIVMRTLREWQNICDRSLAEKALLESEEKYRLLVENLPVKVFIKDRDSNYISCNRSFAEEVRVRSDDIVGRNDYDLYDAESAKRYRAEDRRIMESGHIEELEESYIKDARELYVHTIKSPLKDASGRVFGILGIFWDITARKQAEKEKQNLEKQLIQAQKMEALGVLAGGVAHDFNNILASMLGYIELASKDLDQTSKANLYLKHVVEAGLRARDLIDQILAFSRKSDLKIAPIDLQTLLQAVVKLLESTISPNIEIKLNIDPGPTIIMGDETQLHQVMMNLATNALYAMKDCGGRLLIELKETVIGRDVVSLMDAMDDACYRCIHFCDTGSGMPKEVMERIFEPFFSTKGPGEGSGMGLSVVHGIIKKCGGSICVESEVGKGACFKIFLPLAEVDCEATEKKSSFQMPKKGKGRILFVDDEELLAALGKELLGELGYEVIAFSSGIEALEVFKSAPDSFDLVITDQLMPGMYGDVLARAILEIRLDMPIVLCSGNARSYCEEEVKKMGIVECLKKPISWKILGDVVDEILNPDVV